MVCTLSTFTPSFFSISNARRSTHSPPIVPNTPVLYPSLASPTALFPVFPPTSNCIDFTGTLSPKPNSITHLCRSILHASFISSSGKFTNTSIRAGPSASMSNSINSLRNFFGNTNRIRVLPHIPSHRHPHRPRLHKSPHFSQQRFFIFLQSSLHHHQCFPRVLHYPPKRLRIPGIRHFCHICPQLQCQSRRIRHHVPASFFSFHMLSPRIHPHNRNQTFLMCFIANPAEFFHHLLLVLTPHINRIPHRRRPQLCRPIYRAQLQAHWFLTFMKRRLSVKFQNQRRQISLPRIIFFSYPLLENYSRIHPALPGNIQNKIRVHIFFIKIRRSVFKPLIIRQNQHLSVSHQPPHIHHANSLPHRCASKPKPTPPTDNTAQSPPTQSPLPSAASLPTPPT